MDGSRNGIKYYLTSFMMDDTLDNRLWFSIFTDNERLSLYFSAHLWSL